MAEQIWESMLCKACDVLYPTVWISRIRSVIDARALSDCSFGNAIENDYDAIILRINHIQRSEDCSLFWGL